MELIQVFDVIVRDYFGMNDYRLSNRSSAY